MPRQICRFRLLGFLVWSGFETLNHHSLRSFHLVCIHSSDRCRTLLIIIIFPRVNEASLWRLVVSILPKRVSPWNIIAPFWITIEIFRNIFETIRWTGARCASNAPVLKAFSYASFPFSSRVLHRSILQMAMWMSLCSHFDGSPARSLVSPRLLKWNEILQAWHTTIYRRMRARAFILTHAKITLSGIPRP